MKNNIIEHSLYEKLLKEFHPTKNGDLKLSDFSHGSSKKVWWKCYNTNFDDHEWHATIKDRFNKESKCPCCAGQKTVLSNCLATTNPEISKKWHPTKNLDLTPYMITSHSSKKAWWCCDKSSDHEWESRIADVTNSVGCSCCYGRNVVISNCLFTLNKELVKEWNITKNGYLTPFDITIKSRKKVHWICKNGHEWNASIKNRTNGSGCPECNESHGEKAIAKYLNKIFIIYEREKKFDNCKYKRKLPFDFYLINHNILIEYDGIQHYKSDEFMGGEKSFKQLQIRDAIKTKFAKDNNIPLLRIPYTEIDKIEEIINSFLI